MNHVFFNALTRRASLLTLGAAGLAALAHPITTDAKKKRKKKRNKGDVNKLCKKQVGRCVDAVAPECDDDPDCLEAADRCCSLLGKCDFDGSFACFEDLDAARTLVGPRKASR